MKALLNFTKGFRQSASLPKMILALYALNLLLSLLLAVPLFHSLDDSFGSSLVGERMAQGFDYLWWEEFRDRSRGLAGTFTPALTGRGGPLLNLESLLRGGFLGLPPLLLAVGFLYLILRSLLSGGVLYIYSAKKERFFLKDLLKETVTYAVRQSTQSRRSHPFSSTCWSAASSCSFSFSFRWSSITPVSLLWSKTGTMSSGRSFRGFASSSGIRAPHSACSGSCSSFRPVSRSGMSCSDP